MAEDIPEGYVPKYQSPVFSVAWCSAKVEGKEKEIVLVAGGGGAAKCGIPNEISYNELVTNEKGMPELKKISAVNNGSELTSDISVSPNNEYVAAVLSENCKIFGFKDTVDWDRIHGEKERKSTGKKSTPMTGNGLEELASFQADFAEEEKCVNIARWSLNSDLLATGGEDGVLRVWKVAGGGKDVTKAVECKGHEKPINEVDFSPDGTMLITSSKDKTCRLWKASDGKELCVLPTATGKLDPKAKRPAIYIYRGCRFIGGNSNIITVQTPTRGPAYLTKWAVNVTASGDKADFTATCVPLQTITLAQEPVCEMKLNAAGTLIGIGSNGGTLMVLNAETLSVIRKQEAHHFPITGCAFAPRSGDDERLDVLMSGSADQAIYVMTAKSKGMGMMMVLLILVLLILVAIAGAFSQGLVQI
jgi:prolactin regulatory element-binding protein